jgi:predicted nucleic acid-binding protein
MARLILDSGAVIALAARSHRALAFLNSSMKERALVVVPAVVIAETTRGTHRDTAINRVLNDVDKITPVTEVVARQAGQLLAATQQRNLTIDALVAAEAILGGPSVIMTSDPDDLAMLIDGYPLVRLRPV